MNAGTTLARRLGLVLALACLTAQAARSQVLGGRETLDFDRPEAWAMKYFAALTLFSGFGPAADLAPGSVDLGLEASWVPSLSREQRTVGFDGTKEEDINRTSIFARPRLVVGLPSRLALEASYLPPIDLSGVEPELLALALSRPFAGGERYRSGWRLAAQYGTLSGDFTCSAAEIEHGPNPFDCETPSRDTMTTRSFGVELSVARRPRGERRVEPYASAGVHYLDLDFRVRADYQGLQDRTRLETDGAVGSLTLGLAIGASERLRWAAEVFFSPLDVVRPPAGAAESDSLLHARVLVTYRAR